MTIIAGIFLIFTAFADEGPMTVDKAVAQALEGIKMTPSDIALRNTIEQDSFRLAIVNEALNNPSGLFQLCDRVCDGLNSAVILDTLLYTCQRMIDIHPVRPVFEKPEKDNPWNDVRELPPSIRDGMDAVIHLYRQAEQERRLAFSAIDTFQMDTIRTMPAEYLLGLPAKFKSEADKATIDDSFLAEIDREKRDKRFYALSSLVDEDKLHKSASLTLEAARKMLENARKAASRDGIDPFLFAPDSMLTGDILYYTETEYGPFAIGGFGPTTYYGGFALIVDLGGDDIYKGRAGGTGIKGGFSIAIDLSGDDIYISDERFAIGSGFLGTGIIIDTEGNDTYISGDFGLGTGVLGTGILLDMTGRDSYQSGIAGQGCGFLGTGILTDRVGSDRYAIEGIGQGFGYTGGIGILSDYSGDDTYISIGIEREDLSFEGHGLSLAQGFGTGHRPVASGGIGVLLDRAGNDVYTADIFAQGAGYWFGLGILSDGQGNDKYTAFQFAQGAAAHLAAGIITDYSGTDSYLSWTVSQGLGHDLAVGLLDDRGTDDDSYLIWDLSQGAGNANGIGIFTERGGNDGYLVRNEYNSQGFGNWRREFGSVGIFVDLMGKDFYSGRGGDDNIWTNGSYGIGIDFAPKPSKKQQ